MSEFHECVVGTFDKELQALIDYGHDCCARIDDRIHECCERIREAHEQELDNMSGAYEISMALMKKQLSPVTYDVLGNERHKAVCKLREMPDGYPSYSAFPFAKWYEDLSTALGIGNGERSCAKVRDTLIHLLGGDLKQAKLGDLYGIWKEEQDAMDAGRCGETSAGDRVPAADKRRTDCDGNQLAEEVAPITCELRDAMERYCNFKDENRVQLGESEFDALCDNIDAVHNGLERENKELRHDVEMWRDRAEDMRMERDDALKEHHDFAPESHYVMLPKDSDGEYIREHDRVDWRDHACMWHENAIVVAVCNDGCYVMDGTVFHVHMSDIRHHHEPTVEDVLRGVVTLCHNTWKEGSAFEFYDVDDVMKSGNIADFAAKLRLSDVNA